MTLNHLKTLKVLGCDGGDEVVLSLIGEKVTWHCPGLKPSSIQYSGSSLGVS